VRSKYRILSVMAIIALCMIVFSFHTISSNRIQDFYRKTTHESIYNLKKVFLKDTVNNQITRISILAEMETGVSERQVKDLEMQVEEIRSFNPSIDVYETFFQEKSIIESFTAVIWSPDFQQVLYDPKGLVKGSDSAVTPTTLSGEFASWRLVKNNQWVLMYGITKVAVDDRVKKLVAKEIHDSSFAENSYIWVNEVVDYNGGDQYAIRRIHPNLLETEGSYLSTSMTDIKGNFPYLEELNGVKTEGEIFFTYYFKKKDSDDVAEKLAYAKLYKPYNWIVAMGVHIDDTDLLVDRTTERGMALANALNRQLYGLMASVLTITIIFLLTLEHWVFRKSQKVLEDKINLDQLTSALSRSAGERDLTVLKDEFTKSKVGSAICLFDVDCFKRINDTHGHDVGDVILQRVVNRIRETVRSTDRIYRWGGDEFLLICPGVEKEKAERFFDKIRLEISRVDSDEPSGNIEVTVSMGISYFRSTDHDIQDVIKRADIALYKAKERGRNTVTLEVQSK